ncbi:MAG TPA: hypothetical protein VNH80_01390 [Burkholderiales bacterium]|nr:hypothetical protein [Burkholderiales bacterium]
MEATAVAQPLASPAAGPAANPTARRLRVGLLADGARQSSWVIDAFQRVAASEFAEIAVVAICALRAERSFSFQKIYSSVDRWAFGRDPSELADLAEGVPHKRLLVDPGPAELAALELDVLFVLGGIDDRHLHGLARHGIWRFSFGPEHGDAEALAGWREVAEDAPVTASGIKVRLGAHLGERLAYQSWSRTYPLSVARNRDRILRKTAEFPWRALRELHRSGRGWLEHCKPVRENRGQENRCLTPISDLSTLSSIGRRITRRGLEKALFVEQWFIAYRFGPQKLSEPRAVPSSLEGFRRVLPPGDRYWADPFPLEKGGRYFVFFEEFPFATRKGHISMIEVHRDGRHSAPVRVLERDHHLSYPFLVEHDGALLMIPESAQKGAIEAYRCVDFPTRWKPERVLLDGVRGVDPTFHRAADRWWLFANVAAPGSRMFDDELHLFHAEKLLGDWQPHARNPVKSDARCARPAGGLYWQHGMLHRPAQICAPLYGSGLSINRVMRLTPQEYSERQVQRILPQPGSGLLGMHTVNRAGDLTVVDAFVRRPRIRVL